MPRPTLHLRDLAKLNLKPGLLLNMIVVGSVVFLVKIVAFIKETIVGSTFGLSEFLDTFYIAILIPSFVQYVFIGALNHLFIPNYIYEASTTKKLKEFQTFTVWSFTILCILLSIAIWIFVAYFLELFFSGHTPAFYLLIRQQFYIVLPCLFLWAYTSFLGSLLEIEGKFFLSTIASIFTPTITIIFVLFFKDLFQDLVLALGLLFGALAGFVFLLFFVIHYRLLHLGKWGLNKNIRTMLRQYPPKLASGFLSGINNFVDQFFASQLVAGSLASINYGTKIPTFMVGILMLAVGNVILPHFSRLLANNADKARELLRKMLLSIFIACAILCTIIIIFSYDIIELIFERGEFKAEDTQVVGSIQRIALIYVPFYLCTQVCVKYLTAANRNTFMAWVSFWNMLFNLVLNIILIRIYGIYGLVLATMTVHVVSSVIYVTYSLKSKLH